MGEGGGEKNNNKKRRVCACVGGGGGDGEGADLGVVFLLHIFLPLLAMTVQLTGR